MIIAVISCWKYRDAWRPFFALLDKFWPDHPEAVLLSDYIEDWSWFPEGKTRAYAGPEKPNSGQHWSWCHTLQQFAGVCAITDDDRSILLFQEDFFISVPVRADIVQHGLEEMKRWGAAACRIYPVPGSDVDYGDPFFGQISQHAPYKVSCQATIWKPSVLARTADASDAEGVGTAVHFEVIGNRYAAELSDTFLAVRREANPWPIEYICSGIGQGRWNPDSKRLFERNGIEADYSLRPMAPA